MKEHKHPQPTVGADPEIFLIDRASLQHVPAYGLFGGTKTKPVNMVFDASTGYNDRYAVPPDTNKFFYQEDGAALEFNIPPAMYPSHFTYYLREALKWIGRNLLGRHQLMPSFKAEMELAPKFLEMPAAHVIGCVEDHYAWDDDLAGRGYRRQAFTTKNFGTKRFAGFHIHVGYNHAEIPHHIAARFLDLYLGVPGLLREGKQGDRRLYYGKAGVYRPKDYGIEYRTLSSAVLERLDGVCLDVQRAQPGLSYLTTLESMASYALAFSGSSWTDVGKLVKLFNFAPLEDARRAIETEDLPLAINLLEWINNHAP